MVVARLALLLLAAGVALAAECLPSEELSYIATEEAARHVLKPQDYYFCAPEAPTQFRCQCPTASVCEAFVNADARNLGVCRCCASWVYGLAAALVGMIILAGLFCAYACCCRGQWWCDGYHPAVAPHMPRRGAPVVIPGQLPLPQNVFRGYRSTDFDSGAPPEAVEAAAAARRARRRPGTPSARRSEQTTPGAPATAPAAAETAAEPGPVVVAAAPPEVSDDERGTTAQPMSESGTPNEARRRRVNP